MKPYHDTEVETSYCKLIKSIQSDNSYTSNLRYWSQFVRVRDGETCILCGTSNRLSAHHIVRKSFLPEAALQTGNGICLCRSCHKEFHRGFNGRPNIQLLMDEQGGEKIELLSGLFGVLEENARSREIINDRYYYLSDQVLAKFKMLQGFDWDFDVSGYRIEQAYKIWSGSPRQVICALAEANGFEIEKNSFFGAGGVSILFQDE